MSSDIPRATHRPLGPNDWWVHRVITGWVSQIGLCQAPLSFANPPTCPWFFCGSYLGKNRDLRLLLLLLFTLQQSANVRLMERVQKRYGNIFAFLVKRKSLVSSLHLLTVL